MKKEPTIQKYMTTQPKTIDAKDSLRKAKTLMSELGVRHLPVMNKNEVVGILSDRDIKLAAGIDGLDADALLVLDACAENPYRVEPDISLREVAKTMASKHYGSAIVEQNGKLVGIFTTVDACRALAEIIEMRFHE